MITLNELRSQIEENEKATNEMAMALHGKLLTVKIGELWKKPEFYGDEEDLKTKYSKTSFNRFISECLGYSQSKLNSFERIFALKNGKKLFLKHGRENMVTYLNSTAPERTAILSSAEMLPGVPNFRAVKASLFPKNKVAKKPTIKDEELKKAQSKLKEYEQQIFRLMGVIKSKNKEIGRLTKEVNQKFEANMLEFLPQDIIHA